MVRCGVSYWFLSRGLRGYDLRIPPGPDTRFRRNVFALLTANRRERIEIDARTAVPYWCGEQMDDALAVEGLVRQG